MAIDGRGMFLTCKYAIEAMLPTGGGSIVCLSSISGAAGQKRQAAYGPAKFVASGLTKHLAIEWADRGIRVNAVAPGTIRTERVQQLPDEPGGPEYLAAIEALHPMGRIGEPLGSRPGDPLPRLRRRVVHHRRRAAGRRGIPRAVAGASIDDQLTIRRRRPPGRPRCRRRRKSATRPDSARRTPGSGPTPDGNSRARRGDGAAGRVRLRGEQRGMRRELQLRGLRGQ